MGDALKGIFEEKYKNNSWKGRESKSGPGSSIDRNIDLIANLQAFVTDNRVRSILDCGCGDFNWMRFFNFDLVERYAGIDIVPSVISGNAAFSDRKISFSVADITESVLTGYDLILCKDCLFHLSYTDVQAALDNFVASGAKYLVSTTFVEHENSDIVSGNWRPINLETEPFFLKNNVVTWHNIEGNEGENSDKSVGVWLLNC